MPRKVQHRVTAVRESTSQSEPVRSVLVLIGGEFNANYEALKYIDADPVRLPGMLLLISHIPTVDERGSRLKYRSVVPVRDTCALRHPPHEASNFHVHPPEKEKPRKVTTLSCRFLERGTISPAHQHESCPLLLIIARACRPSCCPFDEKLASGR